MVVHLFCSTQSCSLSCGAYQHGLLLQAYVQVHRSSTSMLMLSCTSGTRQKLVGRLGWRQGRHGGAPSLLQLSKALHRYPCMQGVTVNCTAHYAGSFADCAAATHMPLLWHTAAKQIMGVITDTFTAIDTVTIADTVTGTMMRYKHQQCLRIIQYGLPL